MSKQRLNSLDRFRKQPGRLVLEEHSHCEVPAGCGGVVLRWRNPFAGQPVTLHVYTPVKAKCLLDGQEPQTARIDLTPGSHVLAVALEGVDLAAGLLMVAAVHDPAENQPDLPAEVRERPVRVLSADDGTWKFALQRPASAAWAAPAFDDGGWPALAAFPTPEPDWQAFGAYQCRRCAELGATCLGLPAPPKGKKRAAWLLRLLGRAPAAGTPVIGDIWIRKVFSIGAPEGPGPNP
jgi:hypothetical protein